MLVIRGGNTARVYSTYSGNYAILKRVFCLHLFLAFIFLI